MKKEIEKRGRTKSEIYQGKGKGKGKGKKKRGKFEEKKEGAAKA